MYYININEYTCIYIYEYYKTRKKDDIIGTFCLFVSRERGRDGLYHAKAGRDSILHTEHGA